MFQLAKPLFLTCETPLHAGSGDSLGVVDLPIQRERHTSFPKIEASSLKGALREAFEQLTREVSSDTEVIKKAKTDKSDEIIKAFGPEQGDLHAGAIGFTDARLLLFPVKSMKGVFAWVTCPRVLKQLKRDLALSNALPTNIDLDKVLQNSSCNTSGLFLIENKEKTGGKIVLEEYTFTLTKQQMTTDLADWLAKSLFGADKIDKKLVDEFTKVRGKKTLPYNAESDLTDYLQLYNDLASK